MRSLSSSIKLSVPLPVIVILFIFTIVILDSSTIIDKNKNINNNTLVSEAFSISSSTSLSSYVKRIKTTRTKTKTKTAKPTAKTSTTTTSSSATVSSSSSSSSSTGALNTSLDKKIKKMFNEKKKNEELLPLDFLATHANAFAAAHGLQVETRRTTTTTAENKNDDDEDDNNNVKKKQQTSSSSSFYQCAPISLLPNAYPRIAFHKAIKLAIPFNLLVDKISCDYEFLQSTLGGDVSQNDSFTCKLLSMYNDIYNIKGTKRGEEYGKFARLADRLGIQRSDYMLNPSKTKSTSTSATNEVVEYELKQVELNTIASSFPGLACQVAKLHKHLVERFSGFIGLRNFLDENELMLMGKLGTNEEEGGGEVKVGVGIGTEDTLMMTRRRGVPINPALDKLPLAMSRAYERYKSRFLSSSTDESTTTTTPVILFIVQEGETNTVDQRMIEFQLWENHKIPVIRMSLLRAYHELILDENNGALYINTSSSSSSSSPPPQHRLEVTVVYYRAGYAPTDYVASGNDNKNYEWCARERMECSRATKCPNLGYHLAGTKKVQQELARPGTLERFFPNEDETEAEYVDGMRSAFAGLYSLGQDDVTESDLKAVSDAVFNGKEGEYVLKPQREGGGYNYYGTNLKKKLEQHITKNNDDDDDDDGSTLKLDSALGEFILMQRLFPPKQKSILLRNGNVEGIGESISELGCFGTILVDYENNIHHNEFSGFLLRTKFSNVDEGGVASGFATLSCPYLC